MRVLVLGAGGMLGRDLVAAGPPTVTVIPLTHAELDITDRMALASRVAAERPNVILNAAAYTAVDKAEEDRQTAFRANAEAVGDLGRIAARAGLTVIHFSTDYVFDGQSPDPYPEEYAPNPLNTYGASKLAGEEALRTSGSQYLLIRTQWLFGTAGRSFPRTMWERAIAGTASRVVCDQIGRPTFTLDLAHATWRLIALAQRGVIHVANAGTATWYDIARRVYISENEENLLESCTTEAFPTAARRPQQSVLDTTRLEQILGGQLPPWEDGVDRFLAQLRAARGSQASGPTQMLREPPTRP